MNLNSIIVNRLKGNPLGKSLAVIFCIIRDQLRNTVTDCEVQKDVFVQLAKERY